MFGVEQFSRGGRRKCLTSNPRIIILGADMNARRRKIRESMAMTDDGMKKNSRVVE